MDEWDGMGSGPRPATRSRQIDPALRAVLKMLEERDRVLYEHVNDSATALQVWGAVHKIRRDALAIAGLTVGDNL